MSQNWRTEIDAADYFGHQKKQAAVDNRRPVIRKASDLVGPGIDRAAIQITNFNDLLATYNGYYSSVTGTNNAPTPDEPFVGITIMDVSLGGKQSFIGLLTGYEYTRLFIRNPGDETSISWGAWRGLERVSASAMSSGSTATNVPSGGAYNLTAPPIDTIGTTGTYLSVGDSINVQRQGVYTGYMRVTGPTAISLTVVSIEWPQKNAIKQTYYRTVSLQSGFWIPFTFWTTAFNLQQIRIAVEQASGSAQDIVWSDFSITRVGDSV